MDEQVFGRVDDRLWLAKWTGSILLALLVGVSGGDRAEAAMVWDFYTADDKGNEISGILSTDEGVELEESSMRLYTVQSFDEFSATWQGEKLTLEDDGGMLLLFPQFGANQFVFDKSSSEVKTFESGLLSGAMTGPFRAMYLHLVLPDAAGLSRLYDSALDSEVMFLPTQTMLEPREEKSASQSLFSADLIIPEPEMVGVVAAFCLVGLGVVRRYLRVRGIENVVVE